MRREHYNYFSVKLRDGYHTVPMYAERFEVNGDKQLIFYDAYDRMIAIFSTHTAKYVQDFNNRILWDFDSPKLITQSKTA